MFKRIEKRRRKKEEEEELGLDEDMKQVLGIQDTDSEESDSGSDDDSSGDSTGGINKGLEEEDMSVEDDESEPDSDTESDPGLTVSQAINDPIYVVSVQPDMKACIICPRKTLKTAKMVTIHRTANAHMRRLKKFKSFVDSEEADPNESAWRVMKQLPEELGAKVSLEEPSLVSKRSLRKEARKAQFKVRREKSKAKAKAKQSVATSQGDSNKSKAFQEKEKANRKEGKASTRPFLPQSPPAKKKRKVEKSSSTSPALEPTFAAVPQTVRFSSKKDDDSTSSFPTKVKLKTLESTAKHVSFTEPITTIKSIAKSASERAKNARSRALGASKATPRVKVKTRT